MHSRKCPFLVLPEFQYLFNLDYGHCWRNSYQRNSWKVSPCLRWILSTSYMYALYNLECDLVNPLANLTGQCNVQYLNLEMGYHQKISLMEHSYISSWRVLLINLQVNWLYAIRHKCLYSGSLIIWGGPVDEWSEDTWVNPYTK